MFLSKVLYKPNLVGVIMITLLFGAGFIYAFAFDGFNIEKVTGSEVEAWLAAAGGESSGGSGGGGTDDTPPESPTPENPEDEEGGTEESSPEESSPEDDEDIVSGYEDFDWDNLDYTDVSTWPTPPSGGTYGASEYTEGVPSRDKPARFGQKSYYDEHNGEWRPEKPAVYSDGTRKPGHYNYKPPSPPNPPNIRWINVDSSGEEIEGI